MKRRIRIYAIIAGIVFLISGFGKALATADFSHLIIRYGLQTVSWIAVLIIGVEIIVGLLLVFHIRLKETGFTAIVLLTAFTLIYAYGYFFMDMEDCGCFGPVSVLNTSFAFTLTRNAVLFYLLIYVWKNGRRTVSSLTGWKIMFITAVLCAASFISGLTYTGDDMIYFGSRKSQYTGKSVQNSALGDFVSTSKDSTYLVFAFIYSCPHCLNSIENLKQYEASGTVDKVIALSLKDSVGEKFFINTFQPGFTVQTYDPQTLLQLTNSFPTAYYIKNDTVKLEIHGELPCGYVFLRQLRKMR
ncbi:MAG: hypothetical protein LBK58_14900 [Prevotellaceae bacterium]|jgi:uncharacterized membrane protein YphA (DoxX/SURF4 family)|nr:hypothetical protein [Prevotellaceae bacterium]